MEFAYDDAIRNLAHRPPVTVPPDATLRLVAETLTEELVGVAVVQGAKPPGLVSERDLVAALAGGAEPDRDRATDVMTQDLAAASPDETILEVARRMLANEIRHLPIVEDGAVVRVVSARDVLAVVVDQIEPHRAGA